ncbi:IS21 family transposase [Arthrobacter sp. M4]|uniref:IS21 family transposase n=1 Tax=Arthrobacter sp. M4 TaxID=218160 RepID=UPI001CDBA87C|nr:IS21 family transposase [Arthrobacter sp. M4]MCA4135727.1 IS21 family transposase [Arthrobacter sp. M4]
MDLIELFMHWDAGRSKSELAVSLGMDRKTVQKYLAPAEAEGLVPGLGLAAEEWKDLVAGWFPTAVDGRLRQITWPEFDARIEWVREQLEAGVAGAVVHQRLVDEHGVRASQRSFYRWLAATLPDAGRAGRAVTVLKPLSAPGELGEVDYGLLGNWRDPDTGRGHRVWAFVLTLPFSKQLFVFPTTRMDQLTWTNAHVAAFELFGGVPRRLTPDNLKTGVITPDLYDPRINLAYAELAGHYGTLIDPARGNRPKDKPHVERMVQYVRGSFWAGQSFSSLAQMRAEAQRWCRDVAGARRPRALAGQTSWEVFTAVERPALIPLPARRLEPAEWRTATVGSDCHASVKGVLYSVPYQLVGTRLDVRVSATMVEFHLDGAIVKVHPRIAKGRQTDLSDYPPAAAGFFTRDAAWCRENASLIGPAAAALIDGLLEEPLVHRIRAAQGIIRLVRTHRPEAVETACAAAAAAGDPTLKTVRGLLAAGVTVLPVRPNGDNGAGAYLRGPGAFTAS